MKVRSFAFFFLKSFQTPSSSMVKLYVDIFKRELLGTLIPTSGHRERTLSRIHNGFSRGRSGSTLRVKSRAHRGEVLRFKVRKILLSSVFRKGTFKGKIPEI